MKIIHSALLAGLLLAAGAASAQMVSNASLEKATINTGETAKLKVDFDVTAGVNCGLRVHWGDGSVDNFKINQAKDVPLHASHAYKKAGKFTVKVEPKTQGFSMKCGGANREVPLVVKAPAAAPAKKPAKAS